VGATLGQEERSVQVLAELVAKDAEAAWGIAEPGGGYLGGEFFDEEGAQRFILAVNRAGGNEEGAFLMC
jgi:hypothetical protein